MIIFILVLSRSSYTFANVNCLVIISYIRDNPLSSCYFFCLSSVLHEIHTNWGEKISIGRHALPATWCTNCLNRLMFFCWRYVYVDDFVLMMFSVFLYHFEELNDIEIISTIVKAYALSVIMFHSMIYPDH
jgi:hypothetical protein